MIKKNKSRVSAVIGGLVKQVLKKPNDISNKIYQSVKRVFFVKKWTHSYGV